MSSVNNHGAGPQNASTGTGHQINNNSSGLQVVHISTTDDTRDRQCLKDLCETDPRLDKKRIQEAKGGLLRDSYRWILRHEDYRKWRVDPHAQLLWIKGDPGKGKTMLLCGIIDELEEESSSRPSYFFCQATEQRLRNAKSVLRGLIYMLACRHKHLVQHLREKYDHAESRLFNDTNTWVALKEIITAMLEDPTLSTPILIIDGLDECGEDRDRLLDFISRPSRAKWIVSSRNWPDIEEGLNRAENKVRLHLELNEDSVSQAVNIYIGYQVNLLANDKKYSEELKSDIECYLKDNAHGTFLWVALVCQKLRKVLKFKALANLKLFPPGLDSLYKRMMDQIYHLEFADLCEKILAIVSTVFQPITLAELKALSHEFDDLDGDDLEEIIGYCGSFITLRDGIISFVHQSAKDYILEKASQQIFPSGSASQHHEIFSRSLSILSTTLRRNIYNLSYPGYSIDNVMTPSPDPLEAVRYSCIFWMTHFIQSKHIAIQSSDEDDVLEFFRKRFLYWLESLSILKHISEGIKAIEKLEASIERNISRELYEVIKDARRFLLSQRKGIEIAPLQVYISALIFSPTESKIRRLFTNEEPDWISLKPIVEKAWSPCQQTLEGHDDLVLSVAFSPDSKLVASGSDDNTVKIWEAATGALQQTLEGHGYSVTSVAFSPNSKLVASGSDDNTVKIWEAATGALQQTLEGHGGSVLSVAFSLDSKLIVLGSDDNTVKIWEVATGVLQKTLEGYGGSVLSVAFSPDSKLVASGSWDNKIKIWEVATGALHQTLEGHSDQVQSVAFSPDSKLVASGSWDNKIKIWEAATGVLQQTLEGHRDRLYSVAFSPDSKLVASGSWDNTIKIWEAATGVLQQTLEGHGSSVTSVAFSPNSKLVVSSSFDNTVKIWEAATEALQQTLEGHRDSVYSVAFSPNSELVASGSWDNTIKIWEAATGVLQQTLEGHGDSVNSVAFSPNSKLVVSSSYDNIVKIWEAATGALHQTLEGHNDLVNSVAFSPDSKLVVSNSYDSTIKIWEAATGALQQTLEGHSSSVLSVAFSPDSKLVASGSDDNTVKIWEAATGVLQQTLEGHDGSVISVFSHPSLGLDQISPHSYGITSDKSWVSWNGQKILWLPPDYRCVSSAISSPTSPLTTSIVTIALAMISGKVTIIGFSALGPYEHL